MRSRVNSSPERGGDRSAKPIGGADAPPLHQAAPRLGPPPRSGEEFEGLTADQIAHRLSGPPEDRAAFIRTAAEAGIAEAQAVYGQILLGGVGVSVDQSAALGWFARAAAQHHAMAINMVGRCYDLGWGTPVMKHRAASCFRIAAEMGLDWAMYNYATLLALGEGVAEDKAAALEWLEKAAALGNAKAINFVGSFHEDGWVASRDLDRAAECYARAAEGGDFRGRFNHARMLGLAGRIDEALAWLARTGETATPAFLDKAEAWLRRSDVPGFAEHGPTMLRRGKASC